MLMTMSINETQEHSPPRPLRPASRWKAQQESQKDSVKIPSSVLEASSNYSREGSGSQPQPTYSTVLKRDLLYQAINEFELLGSRLSSYAELLTRLGVDLSPLASQGQRWYLCLGKVQDQSRQSPCRRMVPEVYLRTAVGKLLKAAERPELTGDNLVEELATAFSYAICSEHHRTVHKVAQAIESRQVIEQWRTDRPPSERSSTPVKKESSPCEDARMKSETSESPQMDQTPPNMSLHDWSKALRSSLPEIDSESKLEEDENDEDLTASYEVAERLKVERHYQEYLRASSRECQGSKASRASHTSSIASPASKSPGRRRRKELETLGTGS